ncbi:MAG: hypothetical protein CL685_02850 [Candidatus Magasanikbacteria bacterium]|nr:hypothetical protein [Candidatus Magasanikbacteria bacterium]
MPGEPKGSQFIKETTTPSVEVSQVERTLNELVPILAHGLVRRIEQKGFAGKIRVSSMAGEDWGGAKSKDNTTDIPNVIIYPKRVLSGDKRVVNAQLRHEIGNLNYPIDSELNTLRGWCAQQGIAPELLTSLVEATQEASVNYLEMRNSHSDEPEENFRALYEQEINTQQIAASIGSSSPYKQAVDITLLYSLAHVGLIPQAQVDQALGSAHPKVRELFDKQIQSVLGQIVKMSVANKKMQLIREYVWPKFSGLVALSPVSPQELAKRQQVAEPAALSPAQKQLQEMRQEIARMKQEMAKSGKEQPPKPSNPEQKSKMSEKPSQKEMTPGGKREQDEVKKALEDSLAERLQDLKEQMEQLQKGAEEQKPKPQSLQEMAEQAKEMQAQAQEATEQAEKEELEKLQELMEELKDLQDVAEQLSEEAPEEVEVEDEEPMTYKISEYGIVESELNPEQAALLENIRTFTKETSKVYRKVMRLLFAAYQKRNSKFTPKLISSLKEKGHDLPQFSIYSPEAGGEFLSAEEEMGVTGVDENNFLLNFNLPKPFGKFWYKGGEGSRAQPVKEGEIAWGEFYRRSMPVIWSAVDRAVGAGLYLDRINAFGQHDYKKYYYLWEAMKLQMPEFEGEDSEQEGEQAEGEESEEGRADDSGGAQEGSGEQGEGATEGGEGAGEGGEPGAGDAGEGEPGQGHPGGEAGEAQPHDQFQEGGQSQDRDVESLFGKPADELLRQLRESQDALSSKFATQDESGNVVERDLSEQMGDALRHQMAETDQVQARQLDQLEDIKRQQEKKLESMYREMSGLDGEALRVYVEYMEDKKDFTRDLTDFFIEKFKLDKDYVYERDQRRGAKLQRGYTRKILGTKGGKPVIDPRSFERKRPPEKPQFAWTLIIDNSASCGGDIIEEEKKLAVALVEVAKKLDIPLEIVTFGGPQQYTFLKGFEQDVAGEDLQKMVFLNANQGTPDVVTLDAACASMERFTDKFQRSYNFVYFMTDGQSGSGSIQEVLKKYKRDMVVTGIGLAGAASSIGETWGRNAVSVPDVSKLSDFFIRKIEDQIDQTFD